MTIYINKETAMIIATRFLKQHFSIVHMDAVLEEKMWLVTAQIELFGNQMLEKIRIDGVTGEMHAQMLSMMSKGIAPQPVPNQQA